MRLSSVTCCTIAALLGSGVAAQANEEINGYQPNNLDSEPDLNNPHSADKYQAKVVVPTLVTRITPPETSFIGHSLEFREELNQAESPIENPPSEMVAIASDRLTAVEEEVSQENIADSTEIINEFEWTNEQSKVDLIANASEISEVTFETNEDKWISQNTNTNSIECQPCTPVEPLVLPEINQGVGPALSINIPVGFGADQNTVFLSSTYQAVTRDKGDDTTGSTFHTGLGIGLGNASKSVGVELSYALDTNDDFGDGGFNAKLHKRFAPDFAGSLGWNGFLNTSRHDFEHSLYGSMTKVFRTRESLDQSFSRVAVTAGLGTNQFRSHGAIDAGDDNINLFGNVAVRVARPVSFIAEWSGQDLGLGLSIAPFKNFPLVITPAIRDTFSNNRESRFVLGVGLAKKF